MIFTDIKTFVDSIEKKSVVPVILLHGDESFFIDYVQNWLEHNLIKKSKRDFNQVSIFGGDLDLKSVFDLCRQYPMMSNRRLVLVKQASQLKIEGEALDQYLNDPIKSTILVFCFNKKKVDGRKKWFKTIKEKYLVFESNKIKPHLLPKWIKNYCSEKDLKLESGVAELLAEHLGNDLSKINNEIEKLKLSIGGRNNITFSDIEEQIGISKKFNVFELQDALMKRDFDQVQLITKHFVNNPSVHPNELIISSLFHFFERLFVLNANILKKDSELIALTGINKYFIDKSKRWAKSISKKGYSHIFKILKDYDLRSKGIANRKASRNDLVVEMMGKLQLVLQLTLKR